MISKTVASQLSSVLKCCTKAVVLLMVPPSSFMSTVSLQFQLAFYCHRLCSIFIKMSRKCVNNPDNLCYILGEVTFASRKCSITPTIKKAHFLCFGCKVVDQDKKMGTTRVLHCVFIQTRCMGEWKKTLYAVWSAHGLEDASQSQN